jgi:superfamily II DNA or RNA helicase
MVSRVCHLLQQAGQQVVVEHPERAPLRAPDTSRLRDYQAEALQALAKAPWGQLAAPPRSGKTAIGALDIMQYGLRPAVVLFPGAVGVAPVYQIQEELARWTGQEIGIVGDGHHSVRDVTVMSSASAYEALVRCNALRGSADRQALGDAKAYHHQVAQTILDAKYLLLDESHMYTGPRESSVLKSARSTLVRHGLSGTPWKDDGSGFLAEASIGPVIHRIERGDLVDAGYLVPMRVTLERMKQIRFSQRDKHQAVYKVAVTQNPLRNGRCVDWVRQRVAEGLTGVVIVAHKSHGRELKTLLPEAVEIYGSGGIGEREGGETSGRQRVALLDQARRGEIPIVISTVADMAVDIPSWSFVALACGGKDSARAMQRVSRAATAAGSKQVCYVWDALDNAKSITSWSYKRLNLYLHTAYCDVLMYDEDGKLTAATGGLEAWA